MAGLLVMLIAGYGSYRYWTFQVEQPLALTGATLFTLEKGQYAHHFLHKLQQQGLIDSQWPGKVLLRLSPGLSDVKAGTYEFRPGMSLRDTLSLLSSGREKLFEIRLVEGLRWQDWRAQMQAHPYLRADSLNDDFVAYLAPPGESLEGWLMPDTYHFTAGTNAEIIVVQAYERMQTFLQEKWQQRKVGLPYENPYEALILASIVEKETGLAEERPRIAAVFVNRLERNMRLQTDPTVIYGMGEAFDGNIRRGDLKTPTPYNTYVIKGLPPTPISMVSGAAIDAVLNPLDTDELYFVSRNDGSHVFSSSLADHNAAVRQYQLKK
ncbi:endolytic transglycosylase MltG [Bowmanella dokdonensis]|uniref:Endolytic murein transglycosylase n=2 Tax=Bowmanella dokdonensis TaxID=751969 RepID=A0A939DKY9_9ALTE|nr:endolytic transglycosylase MltG [Bowmanella dokdonensis]MBN7824480.1 endolytic transglycosylase MltG [Bowmanella dokdonensis]